MAADAGAPAGGAVFQRPTSLLPQEFAVPIRDTVDGGVIPNLSWAAVETLTHTWTSKQLGSGGFGEVFKGGYWLSARASGTVLPRIDAVRPRLDTASCFECRMSCARWYHVIATHTHP